MTHVCYFFSADTYLPEIAEDKSMDHSISAGSLLFGACADEWHNGYYKKSPPYGTYDHVLFRNQYDGCFSYRRSYGLILGVDATHIVSSVFPGVASQMEQRSVAIADPGDSFKKFGQRLWSRRFQFEIVGMEQRLAVRETMIINYLPEKRPDDLWHRPLWTMNNLGLSYDQWSCFPVMGCVYTWLIRKDIALALEPFLGNFWTRIGECGS